MKFDRKAPGGGAEAICRLENGKMFLEWRFHFLECQRAENSGIHNFEISDSGIPGQEATIKISLKDRNSAVAAECLQKAGEEEPLETILMQPHLWQGIQEPYLYSLEASLMEKRKCLDRLYTKLPLRVIDTDKNGELLLNGRPFTPEAVRYSLPDTGSGTTMQRLMMEDFQQLLKLGANSICLESNCPEFFLSLCDRFGFLLFVPQKTRIAAEAEAAAITETVSAEVAIKAEVAAITEADTAAAASVAEAVTVENVIAPEALQSNRVNPCYVCAWNPNIRLPHKEQIPLFRGAADSFFPPDSSAPTALYYQYRVKWSKKPFIYIIPESIYKLKSGNYTVTCYSNCNKTALYSDGILFEFREGAGEMVFQEVPAKGPCIRLSAEGEGFSTSFSVHKSFLNFLPSL